MRKTNKKQNTKKITYICDWCGKEWNAADYNKNSLANGVHICNSCIADKYNQLASQFGRDKAIIMCSCILNTPISVAGIRALTVNDDFGIYVRKCNLAQYKTKYTNFVDSLAELPIVFQTDPDDEQTAAALTECIDNMTKAIDKVTKIRNTFKK